ncbi:MAG: sigma-54 dependent transcriptional regulator [Cohaesibacter sp.]|jgi:DNA-binding NtrC family response regulator|nr:sigma-54 dependent transcriptional regulator [Cohaesibacter sp.]
MSERILVVDDDPIQRRLLENAISKFGFTPFCAENGQQALDILTKNKPDHFALMVLDLVMPDLDGMGVLDALHKTDIKLPVIVQTAHGGIDTAVNAMRAGAFDFVIKPISPERLQIAIRNALKVNALEEEITRIRATEKKRYTFDTIIAASPSMTRVLTLGERAAKSQIPILIEGESGVGKELFAQSIQAASERSKKPFVTVNCGAIPDNLVESILFGHEKGAFTGAGDKHTGKFLEANGGTLFLDEVGELPLETQVKLLRALQEGEIDPVGATKPIKIDFRLISATNQDLIRCVQEGKFREDLYYRLNVFPIRIPPLRDRKEDIPALAKNFLTRFAAEEGRKGLSNITPEALQLLQSYDWPGNIRQLENTIFRAVVLCDGDQLTIDEFPQIATQLGTLTKSIVEARAPLEGVPDFSETLTTNPAAVSPSPHPTAYMPSVPEANGTTASAHTGTQPIAQTQPQAQSGRQPAANSELWGFLKLLDEDGNLKQLSALEAEIIAYALEHHDHRMSAVARSLGIGRSTLYRKLKEYGLEEAQE